MTHPMYLCAWSVNHGDEKFTDHFHVFETRAEADKHVDSIWDEAHAWAVSRVEWASEPHWMDADHCEPTHGERPCYVATPNGPLDGVAYELKNAPTPSWTVETLDQAIQFEVTGRRIREKFGECSYPTFSRSADNIQPHEVLS